MSEKNTIVDLEAQLRQRENRLNDLRKRIRNEKAKHNKKKDLILAKIINAYLKSSVILNIKPGVLSVSDVSFLRENCEFFNQIKIK